MGSQAGCSQVTADEETGGAVVRTLQRLRAERAKTKSHRSRATGLAACASTQHAGEGGAGTVDRLFGRAGIAQNQAMLPTSAGIAGRQRRQRDSRLRGSGRDRAIVEGGGHRSNRPRDQVHAAGVASALQPAREVAIETGQKRLLAGGVAETRAAQVSGEMAVGDEAGQRAL